MDEKAQYVGSRLPDLPTTTDRGFVYVVQDEDRFKIGFTRDSLARRVKDAGGVLVVAIPTGQQPGSLERALHQRFKAKRIKGEWFHLSSQDIDWLRGLASK